MTDSVHCEHDAGSVLNFGSIRILADRPCTHPAGQLRAIGCVAAGEAKAAAAAKTVVAASLRRRSCSGAVLTASQVVPNFAAFAQAALRLRRSMAASLVSVCVLYAVLLTIPAIWDRLPKVAQDDDGQSDVSDF